MIRRARSTRREPRRDVASREQAGLYGHPTGGYRAIRSALTVSGVRSQSTSAQHSDHGTVRAGWEAQAEKSGRPTALLTEEAPATAAVAHDAAGGIVQYGRVPALAPVLVRRHKRCWREALVWLRAWAWASSRPSAAFLGPQARHVEEVLGPLSISESVEA
ncbi:unnamed protein product [Diplocarpon coronariae]